MHGAIFVNENYYLLMFGSIKRIYHGVITSCSQRLHALRVHGLPSTFIHQVLLSQNCFMPLAPGGALPRQMTNNGHLPLSKNM